MTTKKIPLDKIIIGPIIHAKLSAALLARIKAYKKILGDADQVTLKTAIDDFRRDLLPQFEVATWERIARAFQDYINRYLVTDLQTRRDVLGVLVIASTSPDRDTDFAHVHTITQDQITELYALFKATPIVH